MALAELTINRMIEELQKGSPPKELSRILKDHAMKKAEVCRLRIKRYESKYGSLADLEEKILKEKHNLEEERTFFNWEATITELKRLNIFLSSK